MEPHRHSIGQRAALLQQWQQAWQHTTDASTTHQVISDRRGQADQPEIASDEQHADDDYPKRRQVHRARHSLNTPPEPTLTPTPTPPTPNTFANAVVVTTTSRRHNSLESHYPSGSGLAGNLATGQAGARSQPSGDIKFSPETSISSGSIQSSRDPAPSHAVGVACLANRSCVARTRAILVTNEERTQQQIKEAIDKLMIEFNRPNARHFQVLAQRILLLASELQHAATTHPGSAQQYLLQVKALLSKRYKLLPSRAVDAPQPTPRTPQPVSLSTPGADSAFSKHDWKVQHLCLEGQSQHYFPCDRSIDSRPTFTPIRLLSTGYVLKELLGGGTYSQVRMLCLLV
jgi:hypothetical protein